MSKLGGGIAKSHGKLVDSRAGRLETKHDRRVDHVLAGGAGVNMFRRRLRYRGDLRGELLDERNGERARAALAGKRGGIESRALAYAADDFGVRGRGRGARQCAFETRHRREESLVGQESGADLVGEEKLEAQ